MTDPESSRPSADLADHLVQPSPASRGRRLFKLGLAVTAAMMVWAAVTSPYEDVLLTGLGLAMIGLAVLPVLLWARDNRRWFPAFETYIGTTLVFQAIPFFGRSDLAFDYSSETIQRAAFDVIAFQLVALLVFYNTRGRSTQNRSLVTPLVPRDLVKLSGWGVWINVVYIWIATFTQIIPWELRGSTRALFFGIGLVAGFVQAWNWGQGRLPAGSRVGFVCAIVAQAVLSAAEFYLIGVITLLGMVFLAYVAASRRLPVVAIAIALPLVAILHHGKFEMRKTYWTKNGPAPTFSSLPDRYAEWFHYGLQWGTDPEDQSLFTRTKANSSLFERASLFQMLALVVANVPDPAPYLAGESYIDLPASLVPRFLWPGKPSSLEANVRLALHFRLVDEEGAQSVSIAFGPIAEAHANFGLLGVIGLAAIMGYAYKRASLLGAGAPLFSVAGLFMILLAAWSCQAELVMATWLASLFQATVVVIGGPLIIRRLHGS